MICRMQYEISIQAMLNPSGKKQETGLNKRLLNINVQTRDYTLINTYHIAFSISIIMIYNSFNVLGIKRFKTNFPSFIKKKPLFI
jgi:hypothetical protein